MLLVRLLATPVFHSPAVEESATTRDIRLQSPLVTISDPLHSTYVSAGAGDTSFVLG